MKKLLIPAVLITIAIFFSGCAEQSTMLKAKLPRSYQMDVNSDKGLIYGKIVHHQSFGKNFVLTFRNNTTGDRIPFLVESFSNDTSTEIMLELEAGEWFVHQIKSENNSVFEIEKIRGAGNKEFILDKAGISYVGTWIISPTGFESKDEKEEQDTYVRANYKNVMTATALVSIP